MRDMQPTTTTTTTTTEDRGVCQCVRQSVCHAAWPSFAVQKWLNGSRFCLGEHSRGPVLDNTKREIVYAGRGLGAS